MDIVWNHSLSCWDTLFPWSQPSALQQENSVPIICWPLRPLKPISNPFFTQTDSSKSSLERHLLEDFFFFYRGRAITLDQSLSFFLFNANSLNPRFHVALCSQGEVGNTLLIVPTIHQGNLQRWRDIGVQLKLERFLETASTWQDGWRQHQSLQFENQSARLLIQLCCHVPCCYYIYPQGKIEIPKSPELF